MDHMMWRGKMALKSIGRRGATLLFFVLLFLGVGAQYILLPQPQSAILNLLTDPLPVWFWGVVWCIPGSLSLAGAIRRRIQPWAFASVTVMLSFWSLLSLYSFILRESRTFLGFLLYAALGILAYIISGWRENDGS